MLECTLTEERLGFSVVLRSLIWMYLFTVSWNWTSKNGPCGLWHFLFYILLFWDMLYIETFLEICLTCFFMVCNTVRSCYVFPWGIFSSFLVHEVKKKRHQLFKFQMPSAFLLPSPRQEGSAGIRTLSHHSLYSDRKWCHTEVHTDHAVLTATELAH